MFSEKQIEYLEDAVESTTQVRWKFIEVHDTILTWCVNISESNVTIIAQSNLSAPTYLYGIRVEPLNHVKGQTGTYHFIAQAINTWSKE